MLSDAELGLDGSHVSADTFRLPTLGPRLVELSRDVHNGLGFAVIRGINPQDYSVEDLTLAYMGIASYVADKRGRQDKLGNMLGRLSLSRPCDAREARLIVFSPHCRQTGQRQASPPLYRPHRKFPLPVHEPFVLLAC